MTVGMISLLVLVVFLIVTTGFELMQIKMLWNELQHKKHDNKELEEIVDLHSKWLNTMKDEIREIRDYKALMRRLP